MRKELLWFFGAMAVVAMVALLVGMTSANVLTAKVVAMGGCLLIGALVSALRDREDSLVGAKFFMFGCTGMSILIGWAISSLVAKHGISIPYGLCLVLSLFMLVFVLGLGFCLGAYWRDRPEEVTIRRAIATCAAYVLPAVVLVPLTIYL